MSGQESVFNMEPLVSPTKVKVKSARFLVASVTGEDREKVSSTMGQDGWTDQGSTRSYGGPGDTVQFTHYAKSLRYYLTRERTPRATTGTSSVLEGTA
jgi:hypothetical protein